MKISTSNRPDGRFCMTLNPQEPGEASPPLRDLLVDASVISIPGDRLAAVAMLAFGQHLRGVVSAERPVSALMSQALARFHDPVFIAPANISSEGTEFTGGGSTFVLDPLHVGYVGRNHVSGSQVIALDVLPMSAWTGRLFSMDRMVVASNADLLARFRTGAAALGPLLAVALAFAHELYVSRIVLPTDLPLSDEWIERASALLSATGVDLLVTSPAGLADLGLVDGAQL